MDDIRSGATRSETAELLANGEIAIAVYIESADNKSMHGSSTVSPDDAGYAQCKARFGLIKAGDSRTIDSDWNVDKWTDRT